MLNIIQVIEISNYSLIKILQNKWGLRSEFLLICAWIDWLRGELYQIHEISIIYSKNIQTITTFFSIFFIEKFMPAAFTLNNNWKFFLKRNFVWYPSKGETHTHFPKKEIEHVKVIEVIFFIKLLGEHAREKRQRSFQTESCQIHLTTKSSSENSLIQAQLH